MISLNIKSAFSQVCRQCKYFLITLINLIHSNNKSVFWLYLVVIFGKNSLPHSTLSYLVKCVVSTAAPYTQSTRRKLERESKTQACIQKQFWYPWCLQIIYNTAGCSEWMLVYSVLVFDCYVVLDGCQNNIEVVKVLLKCT